MKILAGLIRRQLQLEPNDLGHCAVYEKELQRVWPITEKNRKAKIEQFAREHGFRLAYYNRDCVQSLRKRHQMATVKERAIQIQKTSAKVE